MATLTTLIAAALVRLGLQEAKERGWYPRSYYVKSSLDALRQDDLDRAIQELGRAWREDPGEEAEVAREVILMRLDADQDRNGAREAEAKKLRAAAEGEITVLEQRLRKLRFTYHPRQVWVAAGTGAAVVGSSIASVTWFGLVPWIAGAGLLSFAAGTVLLIAVDRRRQRAAHEAYRAQIGAEVAEEIQILRADIRVRDGEIRAAREERERLQSWRARLPGGAPEHPRTGH
jgi:hypothetical protein